VYNLFKFIHVLTVIVWIGGSIVLNILSGRIWKSNDAHRILSFGEDAELIGSRVFAPASGLLLLSGIATVLAVDASLLRKTWVALGVVGWIAVAAISGGLLGPLSQRLKRVLAESGPANPDVRRILQRIERLTRVELVLFVLMIADMVFKPGA
jgi:uncharacterized membrane protein